MASIKWSNPRKSVWVYESEDLCACVWMDLDVIWWDVSGPKGRGTKVSGTAKGIVDAQSRAELYMLGYRDGRKAARG